MAKKPGFLSRLKGVFKRQKVQAVDTSDKVIESLEEQLKKTPNNFRLRLKIADIYLTRGDREQAIAEYCNSARLYAENDFIPLAIATYKKILNEDPENHEANLELGRIYQQKRFYADATLYLKNSFDYYHANGMQDKALQLLETIIEIAPEKEPYQALLKQLFPEYQENARSIYSDLIVIKNDPATDKPEPVIDQLNDNESFFDLGDELGSDINEINITDEIISGNGLTLQEDDDEKEPHGVEEIFETLRSTHEEEPEDTDPGKFHYNLALAYNELKMPEQALQESELALKSNNFRLPTLLLRSQIFLGQNSLSTALAQVQQGLLEKGMTMQDFLTFKMQLGLILKEMGHFPQALEALREAYSLDPDNQELAEEIQVMENAI